MKHNPDAPGPGDAQLDRGRGAPRDTNAAAPPGAVIISDESDDGGPIRIRTTDADAGTAR